MIDNKQTKTLLKKVQSILEENNYSIITAESFTGGLIASTLIDLPGMSNHLKESFIVYSEEAKERILGVSRASIDHYGVVSKEVCQEMLAGLNKYQRNIQIATTGYAGPGENAGYAYLGLSINGQRYIKEEHFSGNRQEVRQQAMNKVFEMIIESI